VRYPVQKLGSKPDVQNGLFPPWFVPMEVFKQFQRLLPALYHQRFRLYFDRYGCIHCKCKKVLYGCSGLCISCLPLVDSRLRQVDKDMKRLHGGKKIAPAKRFLSGRESARQLLADLRGKV